MTFRHLIGRRALCAAWLFWVGAAAGAATPSPDGWAALRDGAVVLIRHADAPGVGDPPGFDLRDCATQRNLDANGRAQAQRIGEQFRAHGVVVGAVRHSQWCRTRDTAELAFPTQAHEAAEFNSFFDDDARAPAQTAAARATLSHWQGPGVLVVVTHQVNITALTGIYPGAGEAVVLRRRGAALEVVGRLRP